MLFELGFVRAGGRYQFRVEPVRVIAIGGVDVAEIARQSDRLLGAVGIW